MTGSYDVRGLPSGIEAEIERLRAQALISWPQERQLLEWLGLRDGMRVLELGCGPGFVTRELLTAYPNGTVTAIDTDPEMIGRARSYVGAQAGRVRFIRASAVVAGLALASFDFAIARLLFQHLSDPVAAAREALRVLRPGGRLAVIDIDAALWGIASPTDPRLGLIHAKASRLQTRGGGDRVIGRRLWRILERAGFAAPRLDAYVYHSDELGLEPFRPQMDPARLHAAREARYITGQEYDTVEAGYRRFFSSPDSYILMVGLMASGTKHA